MDYDLFVMNILWYYKYLQNVSVGVVTTAMCKTVVCDF